MKESKVEEFLIKVDRPWGMSKNELEQFQNEVKQLKSEQSKVAVEKLEELEKCLEKEEKIAYKFNIKKDIIFASIKQKVAELEEWVEKNTISNIISFDTESNTIFYEDIKRKLKDMKGE